MHKNRNQRALNRISRGLFKANKTRNIFAVIAIVMTTFMITTVFSLGISYKENFDLMLIREMGTKSSISLKNPTKQQYDKIKSLDYLDAVGTQINVGTVMLESEKGLNSDIALFCYDDIEWNAHYLPAISDVEGSLPKEENEIMLSLNALEKLGISNPELKQSVHLVYRGLNGTESGEFIICGWFKSYSNSNPGRILFSEKYCERVGLTVQNSGSVFISAEKPLQAYDCLVEDVKTEENQEFNSTFFVSAKSDIIKVTMLILLIVSFIMGSGFLLIYNVFYISVTKDIKRYGMLKTLGTTSAQINKIITNQAFMLAGIGIPIGLVLSALMSLVLVPYALESFSDIASPKVSFSPLIFIGASIFSLLTVLISTWRSAGTAGKISPTEALRYNAAVSSGRKKGYKSKGRVKLADMAWRNIFRNKKQTILVVISLFLGSVALLCINTFLDSMTVDEYVKRYVKQDFVIENTAPVEDEFSQDFIEALKSINGVKNFDVSYASFMQIEFDEKALDAILKDGFNDYGGNEEYYNNYLETLRMLAENGEYGSWVESIDKSAVEEYNKNHNEKINVDDFENGSAVLALGKDSYIGSQISFANDKGEKFKTEITGSLEYDELDTNFIVGDRYTVGMPEIIFVSENFIRQINNNEKVYTIKFDTDDKYESEVKSKVGELCKTLEGATYNLYIKSDIVEGYAESQMAEKIIGNSVSVLLLIVGMLNFINLMIAGVYSRKYEFAVMNSIGVTNKQTRMLVTIEGLYYAVLTTAAVVTIGNVFLFIEAKLLPSVADYAKFNYPIASLTVLLVCIYSLCVAVPFVVYKLSSKATVTERLRDIEN